MPLRSHNIDIQNRYTREDNLVELYDMFRLLLNAASVSRLLTWNLASQHPTGNVDVIRRLIPRTLSTRIYPTISLMC